MIPFLSIENENFTEIATFIYYKQNIFGTGGNNVVYYGKDINSNQNLAVKILLKKKEYLIQ